MMDRTDNLGRTLGGGKVSGTGRLSSGLATAANLVFGGKVSLVTRIPTTTASTPLVEDAINLFLMGGTTSRGNLLRIPRRTIRIAITSVVTTV